MAVYAERRRQLQEMPAQASRAACAGSKDSRWAICGDSGCDRSGGAGVPAGAIFAWRLMSLATCRHKTDSALLSVYVNTGA